jgi:hypothetical protein
MALGIAAVIIGLTALAFALFGWSPAAHPLLGDFSRYLCIIGGVGAMISGSLMLRESLGAKKIMNEPVLEFFIEAKEEEQTDLT